MSSSQEVPIPLCPPHDPPHYVCFQHPIENQILVVACHDNEPFMSQFEKALKRPVFISNYRYLLQWRDFFFYCTVKVFEKWKNYKSPLWVQIRDGSLIPKSKTLSIFIYAFKEHLVNTYYTPGTFLSTKDKTEVEKKTKTFPSWNSHPRREIDNKYIWQEMLWRIIKRSKGWCLSGQKVLLSYRIEEKTSLRNNRRTLMQGRVT